MPKLLVVDHIVNAGGVERFLQGLLTAIQGCPRAADYEVTLLINRLNTAGRPVDWPLTLRSPRFKVHYFFEDRLSRALGRLRRPRRLAGLPGTTVAANAAANLLRKAGPAAFQAALGDQRAYIERFAEAGGFDLAYFDFPFIIDAPQLSMPMVATPHDLAHKRSAAGERHDSERTERQLPTWLERCARLVVSSEFIKEEFRRFYPAQLNKLRVVRLGIPASGQPPSDEDCRKVRETWQLPPRFLLFAGWITRHKNQHLAMEALALLKKRGVRIPILFCGPNSEALREAAAGSGTSGSAFGRADYLGEVYSTAEARGLRHGEDYRALGFVDAATLDCLYRLADGLIVASKYEAGSFPAREAMRAGCPVAAARIPPLEEEHALVAEGFWLFSPEDAGELAAAIEKITCDPAAARQKAARVSVKAQEVFSWTATADGYFQVFDEILGRGK